MDDRIRTITTIVRRSAGAIHRRPPFAHTGSAGPAPWRRHHAPGSRAGAILLLLLLRAIPATAQAAPIPESGGGAGPVPFATAYSAERFDAWRPHEVALPADRTGVDADTIRTRPFDLRVATRARSARENGSGALAIVARVFDAAAFPGTLLVAGALYGIGHSEDEPALADLGLRTGRAILTAGVGTLAAKVAFGRARPLATPDDPYDLDFGRGLRGDRYQSFPSAHTALAFASAAVLAAGLPPETSGTGDWVPPALYLSASTAGAARIYYDEHWATDVLGGALLGTLAALPFLR